MKKLLILAVALLAALNLTGCVVFHNHTSINADGSGTAEMTMSITPAVQEAMVEMKALDDGQSQEMDFPLLEDMDREALDKAAKGHGVKVKKFEKALIDGRETLNIALEFDDLEGFSYVMGQVMGGGDGDDNGMGIFDAGDGNLVLKAAQYDFPAEEEAEVVEEAEAPAQDMQNMDPAKMQKQMEIMGKLMAAMSELDVEFKITVPGDIVSSNAPVTEGRTCVWSVNASNMMTMDQNMDPEIVFSGKGLKIKPITE